MAKYEYVDSQGGLKTVEAATPELAIQTAPGIAKTSGVALVQDAQKIEAANSAAADAATKNKKKNKVTSSSDSVVNDERNITATVNGLSAPDPQYDAAKKASEEYRKVLEERAKALDAQLKSDVSGIESQFNDAKVKALDEQGRETAQTNVALTRTGGYLGTQISAVGVLNNMATQHRAEIASLESKKAQAIQAAKNAIRDKQFQVASALAQEAKDLAKTIYDRGQSFFDNTLKVMGEQRAVEKHSFDRADRTAITLYEDIQGMDEEKAREYIFGAAKDMGIDPNILAGSVNAIASDKREKIQASVLALAGKYVSAGILPTDDYATAAAKVRASREYNLDIRKSELDLANAASTHADNKIDYSDPRLLLYANATGKIVSSPSEARAVLGYSDSILSGKEIVSDDTPLPAMTEGKITETDAKKLLSDSFSQFSKGESELPDGTVWQWLASDEAAALSDEEKKQEIMANGKNPEDFGIY